MVKAKKTIALFVSFLCLSIMGCSGDSSSEGPKYETLTYEEMTFDYYTEWEGYVVSDYRGQEASISIPYSVVDSSGKSFPVTRINDNAFYGRSSITDVVLSSNIVSIGDHAFEGTNLTSLEVTESLYDVGEDFYAQTPFEPNAKDGLLYLGSSAKPHLVLIGGSPVGVPFSLPAETVNIASPVLGTASFQGEVDGTNLRYVCDSAFSGSSLTDITFGSDLFHIGASAFKNCQSLQSVDASNSKLEEVGDEAFSNCKALETLLLPASVKTLGNQILKGCNAIATLTLPFLGPNENEGRTFRDYINEEASTSNAIDLTIDRGKLVDEALLARAATPLTLSSLTLNHVAEIGSHVSYSQYPKDDHLLSLSLGDSLTAIGERAFFYGAYSYVYLPACLESIGDSAFYGSKSVLVEMAKEKKDGEDPYGWYGRITWANPENVTIRYGVTTPRLIQGDFEYVVSSKATAVITKYLGNQETVDVPLTVGGKKVTGIYKGAFEGCSFIKKLSICSGFGGTSIEEGALQGCDNLEELDIYVSDNGTLSGGYAYFGDKAFPGCVEYTIYVDEHDSSKGRTCYIPSSLKTLCIEAEDQVYFWDACFCGYSTLERLEVKANAAHYGKSCFASTTSLRNDIYIKAEDTIEKGAFSNSPAVAVFESESAYKAYVDSADQTGSWAVLASEKETESSGLVYHLDGEGNAIITQYRGSSAEVVVPASFDNHPVTKVLGNVFADRTDITSLSFEGEVALPNYALAGMTSLQSLTFAEFPELGVTTLMILFDGRRNPNKEGCKAANIYAKNGNDGKVQSLNNNDYYVPSSLKKIEVGGSVLPEVAFAGLPVEEIVLSGNLTALPLGACYACKELKAVNLPSSVASIGNEAFSNCDALESLTLPTSLESIGNSAFEYSGIAELIFPPSLKTIGEDAFRSCGSLKELILASSIETIGSGAFANCSNLVLYIEPSSKPASWNISSSVTALYGFSSKAEVNSYVIAVLSGKNVILSIPEGTTDFVVPAQIGSYTIDQIAMSALNAQKGNLTSITIPSSISINGSPSFSQFTKLKTLTIGCSVRRVSISACPLLESASYSYVDQAMSSDSLSNLPSLKTFVVPSGVNAISQAAFDELPALEKIFIPSSVGVIANHAFYQCNPKLTIYCAASSTPSGFEDGWNEDAWDGAWREHTVVFNASRSDVEG